MHLHLPTGLQERLWHYAQQAAPQECVGALGGQWMAPAEARATQFYPLDNLARRPQQEYLAHPGQLVQAFKAMERGGLELVALFHSHPGGPDWPSSSDREQAAYAVPYLIADLSARRLRGFLLPDVQEVTVIVTG